MGGVGIYRMVSMVSVVIDLYTYTVGLMFKGYY